MSVWGLEGGVLDQLSAMERGDSSGGPGGMYSSLSRVALESGALFAGLKERSAALYHCGWKMM
jgi:hypothetical protein